MPFEFVIDTEANVIRETWTGSVDLLQLKESCRKEWADPNYQKHLHMISDFTNARVDISATDIWSFVRWFSGQESLRKHALVVSREVGYGLARMFSSMSDDSKQYSQAMRIFYSTDSAEEWIGDR